VPTQLEGIRQARQSVERVREKLLNPSAEALEYGEAEAARAVEFLQGMEQSAREEGKLGVRQSIRAELAGLRRELAAVNELLRAAGRFYQGWAQLISGVDSGSNYAQDGKTRQGEGRGVLVIHG